MTFSIAMSRLLHGIYLCERLLILKTLVSHREVFVGPVFAVFAKSTGQAHNWGYISASPEPRTAT